MIKENIETVEIKYCQTSFADEYGRIFFYNNKIYRAINKRYVEVVKKLLVSNLFKELVEKELIPKTSVADIKIEDVELVLEHEKLLETYQREWTFSMLKEAALMILRLQRICENHGYRLKDSHLYNVLFRGTKPTWIDIGSITPIKDGKDTFAYEEFLRSVFIPLLLLNKNEVYIANKLLESHSSKMFTLPNQDILQTLLNKTITGEDKRYVFKFQGKTLFKTYRHNFLLRGLAWSSRALRKSLKRKTRLFEYDSTSKLYHNLVEIFPYDQIEDTIVNLPGPSLNSTWQEYHQHYFEGGVLPRFERIRDIIRQNNDIKSVTDLAGNEGYFDSLLLTIKRIHRIVVADYDSNAIDRCFRYFQKSDSRTIHPVLLNFMVQPRPENTAKRLQSDLVLALAITHHLILTSHYPISAIFEKIGSFSTRFVIIEFMPLGLWSSVNSITPPVPDWYSVDWFRSKFKEYFNLISEENLEKNRILFYGEKRR